MGMMPRIEVTIERLIVDGWPAEDAARLAGTLEAALARAFAEGGAVSDATDSREIASIDAGRVDATDGVAVTAIAARVVGAVQQAVTS